MEPKSRCLECSWMGSVVYKPCDKCAQQDADAELGRMVRRLVEINGTLEIDNISTPFGVQSGMFGQFSADTLDESVRTLRAAMEAK